MSNEPRTWNLQIESQATELAWQGFSSRGNLHRHYMKHVARVCLTRERERADPERWQDLWPQQPGMPANLAARRGAVVKKLRAAVPRCPLAKAAPTGADPCADCLAADGGGRWIEAVDNVLGQELAVYEDLVAKALDAALTPHGSAGAPVFFVEREPLDEQLTLVALSPERVLVAALVDQRNETLRAKTGYRIARGDKLTPYAVALFDFNQQRRAAMVRNGLVGSGLAEAPGQTEKVP